MIIHDRLEHYRSVLIERRLARRRLGEDEEIGEGVDFGIVEDGFWVVVDLEVLGVDGETDDDSEFVAVDVDVLEHVVSVRVVRYVVDDAAVVLDVKA